MTAPQLFWRWFLDARERLEGFRHGRDDALLDEIHEQLQSYSPGLWFEIGEHPDGPMELIISADGDPDYFDDVRRLVLGAPSPEGWQFISYSMPSCCLVGCVWHHLDAHLSFNPTPHRGMIEPGLQAARDPWQERNP